MSNWLDLLLTAGKVAGDFAKKNKKTKEDRYYAGIFGGFLIKVKI